VVPSRNVIVPVGLVVVLVGWTVAVSPTVPPTVMEEGVAVTVVVAVPVPLCPRQTPGRVIIVRKKAGREKGPRIEPRLYQV
jgi:hypothetical protein